MKLLIVVCVFSLAVLISAKPEGYPRGCQHILGRCFRECEVGTHAYGSGCSGSMIPEATCSEPHPKQEEAICDYSACYCDPPTVRDSVSGKCVALEDCPKN